MFLTSSIKTLVISGLIAFCTANSVSEDAQECPQVCPANYDPLCATTNGKLFKEFGNSCNLNASNCRLERFNQPKYVATDMDWCSTELIDNLDVLLKKLDNVDLQGPDCMTACPLIYSPVCISNGNYRILLSNECIMVGINCALTKMGSTKTFRILKSQSC